MMNESAGETIKAAGILLMFADNGKREFLLMKHPQRWDLPKGHSEPGETFRQTALRETEEETGIAASEIALEEDFLFELRYPVTYKRRGGGGTFEKQVQYFLGFVKEKPKLVLTEHESARWFPWNPPHAIQSQTIDPLLQAVEQFYEQKKA